MKNNVPNIWYGRILCLSLIINLKIRIMRTANLTTGQKKGLLEMLENQISPMTPAEKRVFEELKGGLIKRRLKVSLTKVNISEKYTDCIWEDENVWNEGFGNFDIMFECSGMNAEVKIKALGEYINKTLLSYGIETSSEMGVDEGSAWDFFRCDSNDQGLDTWDFEQLINKTIKDYKAGK